MTDGRRVGNRVLVLGPGGAGKSTFARHLGAVTGLPVVELDAVYWSDALEPLPPGEWAARQSELVAPGRWILDGDLGPYDEVGVRLAAADTVVVLEYPTWLCVWRTLRRGRRRRDYWAWLLGWHRRDRPRLDRALGAHPHLTVIRARRPADAERLLADQRRA